MTRIRPDQSKYSFDIPTNKYGYTTEEWRELDESYKSSIIRHHKQGLTRERMFKRVGFEERVRIASSIDDRDDFSSEYWENHPYNCEKFVVLDGCLTPFGWIGKWCDKCTAEIADDPHHPAFSNYWGKE